MKPCILGSTPSPAAMDNQRDSIPYGEVFRELNREMINYAVCGGAAVVMLGFARLTMDLDLIVDLDKKNLGKLYDALIKLGYKINIPLLREDFINKDKLGQLEASKNMKVVSFYNTNDPFKVIDVGVNLPYIQEILKNKKNIDAGDLSIPTIFIDDLIKMKEELARPKDLIDVENLKEIKKSEKK